jgi:hypothetical protein
VHLLLVKALGDTPYLAQLSCGLKSAALKACTFCSLVGMTRYCGVDLPATRFGGYLQPAVRHYIDFTQDPNEPAGSQAVPTCKWKLDQEFCLIREDGNLNDADGHLHISEHQHLTRSQAAEEVIKRNQALYALDPAGSSLTDLYCQLRDTSCCLWRILPYCFVSCVSFGCNWEYMSDQSTLAGGPNAAAEVYKARMQATNESLLDIGIRGLSPLLSAPGFFWETGFCPGVAHDVLLGVVKDLWKLLTRGSKDTLKYGEDVRLSKAAQDRIVRETKLLKPSAAFPRGFLNVVWCAFISACSALVCRLMCGLHTLPFSFQRSTYLNHGCLLYAPALNTQVLSADVAVGTSARWKTGRRLPRRCCLSL